MSTPKVCRYLYLTESGYFCNRGVAPEGTTGANMPCYPRNKAIPCESREWITQEEIAEAEAELDRRIAAIAGAREAIVATCLAVGEIECPMCKGNLRFSVAKCNGHIHARCKTENCLQWME